MSNLLAPNGKPSKLTAEQYKLVRTKAFKDWFGDWEKSPETASKVVDENGEPLVVYHGVKNEYSGWNVFNVVNQSQEVGVHFGTYDQALAIVRDSDYFPLQIFSCFLRVINPLKVDDTTSWTPKNYEFIFRKNKIPYNKSGSFLGNLFTIPTDVINAFNEVNIDGLMYQNIYEGSGVSYIVFEPSQIKLADGTNTTFDADNPDIRYDDGGEVEDLINEGIVELKMYETTPEHAREYGISSINPLYIQTICVNNDSRLKGIGKKVLAYIDEYAMNNGNDIVFGHITQKAEFTKDERQNFFCDVDLIKNWLYSNGYAINDDNNDFHKVIQKNVRYNNGGSVKESEKIFGNFAFADEFNPINKTARLLQGTKEFEPDTKLEDKIFEMLTTWTQNPSNAQNIYIKRDILQQAKKDYPKVFAPNFKGLVYRGLSASFEELDFPKNLILRDFEKISVSRDNNYFLYKKPIQYKPKKNVESWTTDIKTAISFGGNVVLISKVDDSFYMNPDVMNEIYYGADEDETIKIGKEFTKNVFVMVRDLEDVADYIKKNSVMKLDTLKFTKRFNDGGEMKKVDKGGITYGKSHDEGGIPVKNASTGQMLEVEGGEGIVNKRSMASDKKVKMNGKEMTICEAVSQLNQMEGGVKFSCDDVKHRQFIEEMELGGELERGIRTEKEHIETLKKLYENRITPNEAIKEVAKEHIAENPNYYSDLQKMEKAKNEYSPMLLQSVEKDLMTYNVPLHLISPIESRDFEYDEPFVRFASGGIPKVKCGCDHKVQKYMNGGIFGGGLDELSYFKEPSQEDKMAEKCVRIIEKARKILNQDLKSKLMTKKLDESLVKYFAPYQKINLYDEGWRFAFGQSKQWAGLCAFKGLEQDRNKKTLYLSVDFVKKDEVFENHFEEVVYHEMAHALVDEYILTKIGKVSMKEIDLLHFIDTKEQPYGHGKIWANICKCLDSNCDVFYRKAQFSSNWKEFKYECSNCGETRYGDTKNFTQICYKCFKAVYVTKNNE